MLKQSMRVQLTLLFVAVFGAAQACLWLIADRARTSQVLSEIDQQLIVRAEDMLGVLEHGEPAQTRDAYVQHVSAALRPFEAPGFYFELRDADGGCLYRSPVLADRELPFTPAPRRTAAHGAKPELDTILSPINEPGVEGNSKFRLATLSHLGPDHEPTYLQVATTLEPTLQAIQGSRRMLILFGVVSLVLAAVTAWFVTGRTLAPLKALARTLRRINATTLQERSTISHGRDEIGVAIDAANAMLERLETEFRGLERSVANISHELKTPLLVLLGEARERRKGGDESFTLTVEQECRKLLRTIDAFLILARAESNTRVCAAAPTSLEDVVLASVQGCHAMARNKRIRITPTFDGADVSVEPQVAGDADLLRALFDNLLQNAIRHSPTDQRIEVRVSSTWEESTVTIRDYGPGIPEDEIGYVFDRCRQVADSAHKRAGSAGLGLAIVQSVAKLHGGSVAVRNVNPGCEFVVTIPLVEA